jgi:hypothetical protein
VCAFGVLLCALLVAALVGHRAPPAMRVFGE